MFTKFRLPPLASSVTAHCCCLESTRCSNPTRHPRHRESVRQWQPRTPCAREPELAPTPDVAKVEGGGISEQQIEQAIDAYMAIYVLDLRLENDTEQVRKEFRDRTAKYPEWTATQRWVREVRASALSVLPGARTSFATTALVMEEALKRYGLWQNRECHAMRHDLMALERGGTGRVPLQECGGQSTLR